ncbi:MAG: hypothetical protein GX851_06680, partial [Clostridiales bacterium]|nr:hypothetical protein [Clostridiales bacterium]
MEKVGSDRFSSSFSYDDIVESTKSGKKWTLEEIDALLADSKPAGKTRVVSEEVPETEEQVPETQETSAPAAEETTSAETVDVKNYEAAEVSQKTRVVPEIDPRPKHNSDIKHNISPTHIERTGSIDLTPAVAGAMESDKYRERFINRPVQRLEKTAEHNFSEASEVPVERPGIVKKKSQFRHTAGLDPLPTIVSAEDELKALEASETRRVEFDSNVKTRDRAIERGERQTEPAEPIDQIKLPGFDENETVEQIDEYTVEEQLIKARRARAKNFKLFSSQPLEDVFSGSAEDEESVVLDENGEEVYSGEAKVPEYTAETDDEETEVFSKKPRLVPFAEKEYSSPKDKLKFSYILDKKRSRSLMKLIFTSACAVILLVLALVPRLSGASFEMFGSVKGYLICNIVLLAVAGIICINDFISGVRTAASQKTVTSDLCSFAVYFFALAQNLLFFRFPQGVIDGLGVYAAAAVFPLVLNSAAKYVEIVRINNTFDFCASDGQLCAVKKIDGENEAFEIGRSLLLGEPDVRYSAKIKFPSDFMELSTCEHPSERLNTRIFPAVGAAALAVAVITGIVQKNVMSAFTALSAALCMGVPFASLLFDNYSIFACVSGLLKDKAAITGWAAVSECNHANAVVLDASDIFDLTDCNIYGIKTFHSMRVDEEILYTASMIITSDGPLANIFDRVILGRRELLPEVESLAYEDKLGLSAWIHNRRVLVGSRELLNNHNVAIPNKEFEDKYLHDGRMPLYLAVEGKIAAMFVVSYQSDPDIASLLKKTERNGLTILVRTSDANITEEAIESAFRLPPNEVKIINAVAGDIFKNCREEELESTPAYILHDGKTETFLRSLLAAFSLNSLIHVSAIVQTAAAAIGLAVLAVLA